jgi:hypothetical protein
VSARGFEVIDLEELSTVFQACVCRGQEGSERNGDYVR